MAESVGLSPAQSADRRGASSVTRFHQCERTYSGLELIRHPRRAVSLIRNPDAMLRASADPAARPGWRGTGANYRSFREMAGVSAITGGRGRRSLSGGGQDIDDCRF